MIARLSILGLDMCFSARTDHARTRHPEDTMSKYLSLLQDPQAAESRVAAWHKQHAARAYFIAIEAEIVELAVSLTATGRAVTLDFSDGSVCLNLRERGPRVRVSVKAGEIIRAWHDASTAVARTDEIANVPVPSNPAAYGAEAEETVRALMPTINELLG